MSSPAATSSETGTYTFSGSGTKTLYVWFKDNSGNIFANASDSIGLVINYASCQEIKEADPTNTTDGVYTIDLDGSGSESPFEVYCEGIQQSG